MGSRLENIRAWVGACIGLNVHDPTDFRQPLKAGMTITIEPGIYIRDENLGVRIEDDVLVTADGHRLMTEKLARNADEVEKVMARAGRTRSRNESILKISM